MFVARTAITDSRILAVTDHSVTFRWKDRSDHNRTKTKTVPGVEFVARYFRHVLPKGVRSVRYYGFCHPSAKATRLRVQLHSGRAVSFDPSAPALSAPAGCSAPLCPKCRQAMQLFWSVSPWQKTRGPPRPASRPLISSAA
jgi:hypothetical protein